MAGKVFNMFLTTTMASAFDNNCWKMDGDKLAVDTNGNPIFINAAGQEQSVQGDTITRLNGEAKTNRERAEKAEQALEPFKGIDPAQATKAIETVKGLDAKTLIDAGKLDEVREQVKAEFGTIIAEKDKVIDGLNGTNHTLMIDKVFDSSEFVRDQLAVPRSMFQAEFKGNFKVEDGKVVAYGRDGNRLLSKANQGDYADANEALRLLVDMHPQKDQIIKAQPAGGAGGGGAGGNRGVNGRTITRAAFNALNPMEQAATATNREITIVD